MARIADHLNIADDFGSKALNQSIEPGREKTNNLGSDQAQHKAGCTITEED